ncbi:DUF2075 domain-containing protein [Nesterenkonia haasae]|uniref:DUF2075 domain-containing protein n=1 Tax=Nesterenkonia haasae TaxID=2587813 RepID=UPI0013914574|nr:DUF2075 domain-containing protein [Nesterenkonia haasae]NDK31141.1 DUF2075 domain-containing protein [Nesterenkonia haasae]
MTSFRIETLTLNDQTLEQLARQKGRYVNWPAVYALRDRRRIYVGESRNVAARLRQHMASDSKRTLEQVQIVLDETFNKSAALDLEAFLIQYLGGEGKYSLLNRNKGIIDAEYFDRFSYRELFRDIFEQLRYGGTFERTLPEIENDDLFKLSPFKALTPDQAVAVEDVVRSFFSDGGNGPIVVQGDPGTGKTVVAIYLMKLLADIAASEDADIEVVTDDADARFAEFFTASHREQIRDLRIGIVIPQQSLRASVEHVFRNTPDLHKSMVLNPFKVGSSEEHFDLLVVDEAHRLNRRANQASPAQNRKFAEINKKLFGRDDDSYTQLDWIVAKSDHQILLLDSEQSVRPADIPDETWAELVASASRSSRFHRLRSQLRVRGGERYIDYIRSILWSENPQPQKFPEYELQMFDNVESMHRHIKSQNQQHGLARLVAGFAWPWVSKNDKSAFDIEIDGYELRWNSVAKDWINSKNSVNEVGSIHTVQGYDLNYAGVIIGPDLTFDELSQRITFVRSNYHDKKGRENNPRLGITYDDDDLLKYVINIYKVLLTRAIKGTYVYVADPELRRYLQRYFPRVGSSTRTIDIGYTETPGINYRAAGSDETLPTPP